jgi:hypothetical protein
MTHVGPSPTASASARPQTGASFIEWSAIFAGAVLAAALSFVFLTFGAAIGLSFTSPWPNSGASAKFIAAVAILWVMVQQIGAFMAGAYVAGRLRSRWHETTEHEIEFRDGLHGALVWAVGLVIGAAMLMATAGAVARTGVEVAGKAAAATAASTNAMDGVLDAMLRPVSVAQAQSAPPAGAPATAARPQPSGAGNTEATRAEIGRIMATSVANGSMTPQDRAYLAQIVAQRTGVPQPEAEKRVTEALNSARETADKARRAAVLAGFVTAAALVVSFGAAWWAAMKGGQHRDHSVPARFEFGNRLRRPGAPAT